MPLHFIHIMLLVSMTFGCVSKSQSADGSSASGVPNEEFMNAEMQMRFTASPAPAVGFGYTFACTVQDDNKHSSGIKSFNMTVLVSDSDVWKQLADAPSGRIFVGRFRRDQKHVEYNMMPITGFVDSDRTAWKLIQLD